LRRGSPPGVAQGGTTPNAIKRALRKDFAEVAPLLKLVVKGGRGKIPKKHRHMLEEGEVISMRDRLRALDILGKYAMDQNVALADVRAMLVATRAELAEFLPKEQFETIWPRIMGHWVKL
jgi:hypothetical protein